MPLERARDINLFSDFPKTDDETVKEWMKNVTPYINFVANIGQRVNKDISKREHLMKAMKDDVDGWSPAWAEKLALLKELRGAPWERPLKDKFTCSKCGEETKITDYDHKMRKMYLDLKEDGRCESCARGGE